MGLIQTTTWVQFRGCPNDTSHHDEQYFMDGALHWERGHLDSHLVVLPLLLPREKQLPDLWEDQGSPWQTKPRLSAVEEIFCHRGLCWLFSRAKREVMSSFWMRRP